MTEHKETHTIRFPTAQERMDEHAKTIDKELDDWVMNNILSRIVKELADPKSVFGKQLRILLQEKNDETDSTR